MVKRVNTLKNLEKKGEEDLRKSVEEAKKELVKLRNDKSSSGSSSRLAKIKKVRKDVARLLTVLHKKSREALRGINKKAAIPYAQKLTRAIRRRLTKKQREALPQSRRKTLQNFGLRKYAIKA